MADQRPMTFHERCNECRDMIRDVTSVVKDMKGHYIFKSETDGIRDEGEMQANLTIAYRHLEDARMRIGKAIQAYDGGVSVYDKGRHGPGAGAGAGTGPK